MYALRYDHHVKHVFPNFTITNCEACHEPGTFNVPNQAETMPGVLSASYELNTWYGIYGSSGAVPGKAFDDPSGRNIGDIPEYVTGPASRACGGCHRARFINQDEAGALASWNAHTQAFGTYSENDSNDQVMWGVIEKIMGMFQ